MSLAFYVDVIYAQEKKDSKKENKKQASADFRIISLYVDSMAFVLEADVLRDGYGNRVNVSSSINFIMVNSDKAVLQTGNMSGPGYNGVGGTTAEGNIRNWKVNKNENKEYIIISMDVMTSIGQYSVVFNVSPSGYSAATLSGLWKGKLTWEGRFVPLHQSSVYEGRSY